MSTRNWNPEQLQAIESKGGTLLVSAAAGSGKTAVLTERVLRMLTDEEHPVDADRFLIMTFTRLAAGEMKNRITEALSEKLAEKPGDIRLIRQQILLEKMQIGTIDAFCLNLVLEQFGALGISPQSRVASEKELGILKNEALAEVMEEKYAAEEPGFLALSETLGAGRDDSDLADTVLRLYDWLRTQPHYGDWLDSVRGLYNPDISIENHPWGKTILAYAGEALRDCAEQAEYALSLAGKDEDVFSAYGAALCSDSEILKKLVDLAENGGWDELRGALQNVSWQRLGSLRGYDGTVGPRAKEIRDGYKKTVSDLAKKQFFASEQNFRDDVAMLAPLAEDLFSLTMEFDRRYSDKKRENLLLDYADLEHFTLGLLTEKDGAGRYIPTAAAREISARYEYILVDECQDINAAQDAVFRALSRHGENLFYVGDVKQSIYRFRQAMPELFLQKRNSWPTFDGSAYPAVVTLGRNYRSRKDIAGAVNFLFSQIMTEAAAEMDYGPGDRLIASAEYPEDDLTRCELLLAETDAENEKYPDAEAEAIAEKIAAMVKAGVTVKDGESLRPAGYSDFCVLLRAMKGRGDRFAEALRKRGIGVRCERSEGFFSRPEIAAVMDVLRAIDNPLLDLPLAGAMLSEMFLFTPDDLARIRLKGRTLPFFRAVKLAAEDGDEKCARFLDFLSEMRTYAACESSDAVLERIYEKTQFPGIMRAGENGEAKLANLRLLVRYASEREAAGWKGIFGFLRFADRLIEKDDDLEPAGQASQSGGAVRIMTVHGAKGLEFPIVFFSAAGRKFHNDNRVDRPAVHPTLGFACAGRDETTGLRYKTVPQQALGLALKKSSLAEEMRILYVALTRAKERLIITGAVPNAADYLSGLASGARAEERLGTFTVTNAKSPLDWVCTALLRHPDAVEFRMLAGLSDLEPLPDDTRWVFSVRQPGGLEEPEETAAEALSPEPDRALLMLLEERAAWAYPYAVSASIPAKKGVSELTHGELYEQTRFSARPTHGVLSGAERGTALHAFMEFADFEKAERSVEEERKRLADFGFLTAKQASAVDPAKLRAFFQSGLYQRIKASPRVLREYRFMQDIPAKELGYEAVEEMITVQGVADCIFEENGGLYILDYKTDYTDRIETLGELYGDQLRLYKKLLALSMGREAAGLLIWSFHFGRELAVE
ncbi:MAG TPA: helicase-exonuclease AddAB subunit AddA [Oscillospiraceae bacterium]|nr:helicase-exonuclease AddAB subunit AddA [Oscillospiraceae bacterium]HRW56904.1 helicase-exonuclease AddAB subunit AddA [Oscillospiraceae bacterium]